MMLLEATSWRKRQKSSRYLWHREGWWGYNLSLLLCLLCLPLSFFILSVCLLLRTLYSLHDVCIQQQSHQNQKNVLLCISRPKRNYCQFLVPEAALCLNNGIKANFFKSTLSFLIFCWCIWFCFYFPSSPVVCVFTEPSCSQWCDYGGPARKGESHSC